MDRKQIKKPLKQYVERLKQSLNPEKIILYGSFARDEATEWSDIDMVVLTKNKKISIKAIDAITKDIDSEHLVDIRVVTPQEYNRANHLSIYHEVKKEGIVLYQKLH